MTGMVVLIVVAVLVSACTLSAPPASPTPFPDAAYTAAAQTVIAEFTQNAPPATPTPVVQATPTSAAAETATEEPTEEIEETPIETETREPAETPQEQATLTPTRELTLVFEDDFSEETGWFVDEGDEFGFVYVGEAYHIYSEILNSTIWTIRESEFADVHLEVEAKRVDGAEDAYFGLVCRHQDDEDSYYGLVIGTDGFAGIGQSDDGEFEFIETVEAPEGVIEPGQETNLVQADCVGDTLAISANGERLLERQDDDFASGFIGLVIGTRLSGGVVVEFDNYAIYEP
jgi:hypothetical protein